MGATEERRPGAYLSIYGYTIGGPVGKPGRKNKLFFFYAHEYRPQTLQINSGNVIRLRLPTQAERGGDFSQTRDQNGNLLTSLYDSSTGTPFPGLKIPAQRLYAPGLAVLNHYLRYCPDENVDLSIVRRIAFGKIFTETRRLEFRADIFNALNTVIINAASTTATFNTPAGMALQNNQYLSDGTLNPTRLQPKNAGFGAATGAQSMRNLQLQLRFSF